MPVKKKDVIQLIGFSVGPKLLGADILTIREILRNPKLETVEDSPPPLKGVVRVRGEIIPVVDMADCIRHQKNGQENDKSWLLICQSGQVPVGYCVDSVTNILRADVDAILPAPELIMTGLRRHYLRGVCETEKGLLIVVNLERMLDAPTYNAIATAVRE